MEETTNVPDELLCEFCAQTVWHSMLGPDLENVHVARGYADITVTVPKHASNIYGNAFGGYLSSVVDLVASPCAASTGKWVVTQSTDLHFIRSVKVGQRITAEARVAHAGRTSNVVEICVREADSVDKSEESACVLATATMYNTGTIRLGRDIVQKMLGRK